MLLQIVGKRSLLADQIDSIYDIFTKSDKVFDILPRISMLIGGIGALFYISYRIWKQLANGEPITIFPLLRPFAIGLCISFFPVIIGFINAVLYQIIAASEVMGVAAFNKYMTDKKIANVDTENFWSRKMIIIPSPDWEDVSWYRIDKYLTNWWQEQLKIIIEIILFLFLLFLNIYRFIGLCILYYVGPIAFGLSIFDGFQNSLNSWIIRYVNMYLWLPVANIIYSLLSVIAMIIQNGIDKNELVPDAFRFWALAVFSIFCIFVLSRVPQITSWIVQAPMEDGGGVLGSASSGASSGIGAGISKSGREVAGSLIKAKTGGASALAAKGLKK